MIHTADSFEKAPFVEAVVNRKFMPRPSPLAAYRQLRLRPGPANPLPEPKVQADSSETDLPERILTVNTALRYQDGVPT